MALISIGAAANDGTGDPLRTAFQKVNRLPIWNAILNADSGDYAGTAEAKITACVADAVAQGKPAIWIPKSLQPFTGSLVTSNAAVLQMREGGPVDGSMELDAYGVTGDGVTDVTALVQTVENLRPAWRTLKGVPGKTYALNAAVAANLLKVKVSGMWDFSGATLLYTNAATLTIGGDGLALGVVNVLTDDWSFLGTIDCNNKARYALALLDSKSRFYLNCTIQNTLETNGVWPGIFYSVSSDVSGVARTSFAKNVHGFLRRPNCPLSDAAGTITGHSSSTALILGDDTTVGAATGIALVSDNQIAPLTCYQRMDTRGINIYGFAGTGNSSLGDILVHDVGLNTCEFYGTNQTNSDGVKVPQGKRVGPIVKGLVSSGIVVGGGWWHDDASNGLAGPNVWIDGGAVAGAGLIDLNPVPNAGGVSTTAGGRLVDRLLTPTEAVLVSGVDAAQGNGCLVTLTAARVVGAPLNPRVGQRFTYQFVQDATGGRAVTWNAIFKHRWADGRNGPTTRSSITFQYDGTTWNQVGEQAPYTNAPKRADILAAAFKHITATVDKQACIAAWTTVTQQLQGMAVGLCAGEVVTGISLELTNTPTSLTLAKVGLYDQAGNRLAASNSDHANWTGALPRDIPFTAPFTVTADALYYLCVLVVVTGTVPTLLKAGTLAFAARNANNGGALRSVLNAGNADLPVGPVTWSASDGGIWLAAY